jgi:hypothetical protein
MTAPSKPKHRLRVASRPLAVAALAACAVLPAPSLVMAAAPTPSVGGMGDINLYPKRVVITDRSRVGTIGIYNKSANSGDYTISVADMVMTPDGRLIELAAMQDGDPAKARIKGAADMLRWSPRRFTLPGNEAQLVRLMARVSPDLPPGEYRTHFSVIAVPPGDEGLTIDEATSGQRAGDSIGVRITPRFGISIPVIIRIGETTLTSGLKDLAVITDPGGHRLVRLTITRSGTRSSFGDIAITAPGTSRPVALIRGIGVYTEIDERTVAIPVDPAIDQRLTNPGAHLTATYTDDDHAPGKTLARTDFTVP